MTQHDAVETNDELYIYSKATGYLKAWAQQTKGVFEGMAYLKVAINAKTLPGISEMTINTNTFDVWQADNPVVLKRIAENFIHPEWTR
jgi:hypothetical protein